MFESYLYFTEQWGIPGVWLMPIHSENWDEDDVLIYKEQLDKIYEHILSKCIEYNSIKYLADFAPLNKALEREADRFNPPCGAGKSFVSITADGSIYPCHQFYYIADTKKPTKLGSIYSGIDKHKRAIFLIYDGNDLVCHQLCACKAYECYRCIADFYQETGCMLNTVPSGRCKMSWIEDDMYKRIRKDLTKYNFPDATHYHKKRQVHCENNISFSDINDSFSKGIE